MSAQVLSIAAIAGSFPTVQVAVDDLLGLSYRTDARGEDGQIDCLGIVLEVYRRAGLLLPDPKSSGSSVFAFADLFDKISDPTKLYDLINFRRESHHVLIVVRPGIAMSCAEKVGVYTRRINVLKRASEEIEYYRLRTSSIPA